MKLLIVVISALLLGCTSSKINNRTIEPLEFEKVLSGWWDEGNADEIIEFCSEGRNLHRHIFSEDGKSVIWSFQMPYTRSSGEEVMSYNYKVLDTSSVMLTLKLQGETRKLDGTNLAIWELVIVDDGLYRWRAKSFSTGTYNSVWGRRCY